MPRTPPSPGRTRSSGGRPTAARQVAIIRHCIGVLPGASSPLTPKSVSLGTGELYSSSVSDRHNGAPTIPDYEVLRLIGRGAYGEVWLARSTTGLYRAVKVVRRRAFDHDRPFEREFEGIQNFEPISHSESQVHM